MGRILNVLWPTPGRLSTEESAEHHRDDCILDNRIKELKTSSNEESLQYLEAARRVADEEGQRKMGAESRATTYLAAVAALIPLMTWAIGNTAIASSCTNGWWCITWTATFVSAIVYFIASAYWALRTLGVANYQVIGIEDIVTMTEQNDSSDKAPLSLLKETLSLARNNRSTINFKMDLITASQRSFFNGLFLMCVLLALEPIKQHGVLQILRWADASLVCSSKSTPVGTENTPAQASATELRP